MRFIGALLVISAAVRVGAAVSTETITSLGVSTYTAQGARVKMDSHNNLYMIYFDTGTELLNYAYFPNGGTGWSTGTVTSNKTLPFYDLAIGPNNVPQAAFFQNVDPKGVRRAYWLGDGWASDTVDLVSDTHTYVAIAVGADNRPHIVYNRADLGEIWLARHSGGWVTGKLFNWTGGATAAGVGSDGLLRIMSMNSLSSTSYATYIYELSTGTFGFKDMDFWPTSSGLIQTQRVGLAIDGAGKTHLSYAREDDGLLRYSLVTGIIPSTSVIVDPMVGSGLSSDIAVNSSHDPLIVYFSSAVGLSQAVYTTAWSTSTLEAGALNGVGPGVIYNRLDHYFCGYLDGAMGRLRFMTDAGRDLSLEGTILDYLGSPIPGASLTLSGAIASSDISVSASTGGFVQNGLWEGNYFLTPAADGYVFEPEQRVYVPLLASKTGQEFKGGKVAFNPQGNVFDPTQGEKVTFNYSALPGHLKLDIYNSRGRHILTLLDQEVSAGDGSTNWNGLDDEGRIVASGVYLAVFEAHRIQSTKKVVVVK